MAALRLSYKRHPFFCECEQCSMCHDTYFHLHHLVSIAPSSPEGSSYKVYMNGTITSIREEGPTLEEGADKPKIHLWKQANGSGFGFAYCETYEDAEKIANLIKSYISLVMRRTCTHEDHFESLGMEKVLSDQIKTFGDTLRTSRCPLLEVFFNVLRGRMDQEQNRGTGGYNISPHHLYIDGTVSSFGLKSTEYSPFTKHQQSFFLKYLYWPMFDRAKNLSFVWTTDLDSLLELRKTMISFYDAVHSELVEFHNERVRESSESLLQMVLPNISSE